MNKPLAGYWATASKGRWTIQPVPPVWVPKTWTLVRTGPIDREKTFR